MVMRSVGHEFCTYADTFQQPIEENCCRRQFGDYFIVGRRGLGMFSAGSCPCQVTPSGIEATAGALTRLRRLADVTSPSASSVTAHAPGVGGIQLYGGPYGWVRAGFGLGFGSAPLSFSLRV